MATNKIPLEGKAIRGEITVFPETNRLYLTVGTNWKKPRIWKADTEAQAREFFASEDEAEQKRLAGMERRREERKAWRKNALAEMLPRIVPGVLLHGSWGYEQTNCEAFEVESVKGTRVILKPVVYESAPSGPMSENRTPIQGAYKGDSRFARTISAGGVKWNDHCTLTPQPWGKSFYSSWYA